MSVTRVPLQPIEKGSLSKLWLGVALCVILAAILAWVGVKALPVNADSFLAGNAKADGVVVTESGLQIQTLVEGDGVSPTAEDFVQINYTGRFINGDIFDQGQGAAMPVSGLVPGFTEALLKMKKGGKYRIWIPPALGYGEKDTPNPQTGEVAIPGNSVLDFDVELLDVKSAEDLRKLQEQMMQQGAAPPPM